MTKDLEEDTEWYEVGSVEAAQAVTAPPRLHEDGSGPLVYVCYCRSGQDMYLSFSAAERWSDALRERESRGAFKPVAWWNGSKWELLRAAWRPWRPSTIPAHQALDRKLRVAVPGDLTEWTDQIS